MFEAVYQQDRHHGKAAQGIHRVDTGLFCFSTIVVILSFIGVKIVFNRRLGQ